MCTQDICIPDSGCYNNDTSADCSLGNDPCARPLCDPNRGCVLLPRRCVFNESKTNSAYEILDDKDVTDSYNSSSSCQPYAVCEANTTDFTHKCSAVRPDCGFGIAEIAIATGVGAAAIAGICIGILLFIFCAGGSVAAVVNKYGVDADAAVNANPLYEDNKRGGANPLWQDK